MGEAKKRKTHTAEFKAKVGLEALKEVKQINEIGQEYGVHPSQVALWKKEIQREADLRVDTPVGRFHIKWDEGGSATVLGQLPFFSEWLEATGLLSRWVENALSVISAECTKTTGFDGYLATVDSRWATPLLACHCVERRLGSSADIGHDKNDQRRELASRLGASGSGLFLSAITPQDLLLVL